MTKPLLCADDKPPNGWLHPPGGFAAGCPVQDDLNNETTFKFEPRLAGSGASRVGRLLAV